jgi:hypothetical protein
MLVVKTRLSVTTDLSVCIDSACEHRASFFVHLSEFFLGDIPAQASKYSILPSARYFEPYHSFVTPPTAETRLVRTHSTDQNNNSNGR